MDRKVVEFLIRAKKATYAGKGAETSSSREKSHDLVYRDGDYMYYDIRIRYYSPRDVSVWSKTKKARIRGQRV